VYGVCLKKNRALICDGNVIAVR